jgi:RNA polymerase sigma-70 factor (ECF subfamily)
MNRAGNPEDVDGPRQQLAAAYDRHGAALYRHALMILMDPGTAEDAVQQAFAKLAAMGQRMAQLASEEHYLRIAVRNECYRLLDARRRRPTVDMETVAILEPVETAMVAEEQRQAIESGLRALPAEQREVVHLKVYESMTFQQIANVLGLSLNTAASRYRYAMDKLRSLLADLQRDEVS